MIGTKLQIHPIKAPAVDYTCHGIDTPRVHVCAGLLDPAQHRTLAKMAGIYHRLMATRKARVYTHTRAFLPLILATTETLVDQ